MLLALCFPWNTFLQNLNYILHKSTVESHMSILSTVVISTLKSHRVPIIALHQLLFYSSAEVSLVSEALTISRFELLVFGPCYFSHWSYPFVLQLQLPDDKNFCPMTEPCWKSYFEMGNSWTHPQFFMMCIFELHIKQIFSLCSHEIPSTKTVVLTLNIKWFFFTVTLIH